MLNATKGWFLFGPYRKGSGISEYLMLVGRGGWAICLVGTMLVNNKLLLGISN